jgi:hypothetical protein
MAGQPATDSSIGFTEKMFNSPKRPDRQKIKASAATKKTPRRTLATGATARHPGAAACRYFPFN